MREPGVLEEAWEERAGDLFPPAPAEAEALLWRAARSWSDTDRARGWLLLADRDYGDLLPVVLGCYKFHFYKGLLREAIPYAEKAARIMGEKLGLPADFFQVRPEDADFSGYEAAPRFYLFAMKAVGYLHARLGETERAVAVLEKILELDRKDRLGVSRLMAVIERKGGEEE